jgi:hypothetical protein
MRRLDRIHVEIALQRRQRAGITVGDVILDAVFAEGDALDDAVADQMDVDRVGFVRQVDQVPDLGIAPDAARSKRGRRSPCFPEGR